MRQPSTVKTWFMATRPSSLVISAAPVFVATAMAFGDGVWHLPSALAALWGAIMIHVGTNLTNDYYDLKKGADKIGEVDPMRGIAVGQIHPQAIKHASLIAFTLVMPSYFYLVSRAGWPIVLIGIFSILAGYFYTAGKHPLGYLGFGDILVLVFFGPVALAGTYYVQSLEMNLAVVLAGLALGLFPVGVLTINNIRDFEVDLSVKKRTLVVRFGREFGHYEYLMAILCLSLFPVLIYAIIKDHLPILACSTISLLAIPAIRVVLTRNDESALNSAIGSTIKLLLIYSLVFAVGWIL